MVRPEALLAKPGQVKFSRSLGNTAVATKTVPPRLTITIQDCTLCRGDLKVGTTDLDEWVVSIEVLPEGSALEGDLGAGLQLRQIDG